MQFAGIRARQRRAAPPAVAAHTLLSMYKGAARYEVTIGDFEVWALNRLRGACGRLRGATRPCLSRPRAAVAKRAVRR